MNSDEPVTLSELEPLLLRAELLLERAVHLKEVQRQQRLRELAWMQLELSRCALPLQQLGEALASLMGQMDQQRQNTLIQRWQAALQQGLRQLEAVTLQLQELETVLASGNLPSQDTPLVQQPALQLQELLTRRQRQMAVLQAELDELHRRMVSGADASEPELEPTPIPALFDDQG